MKLPAPTKAILIFIPLILAGCFTASSLAPTPTSAGTGYSFVVTQWYWDGWDCYPWSGITGGVPFGSCNASTVGNGWSTGTCLAGYSCGGEDGGCGNFIHTEIQCVGTCTPDSSCAASTYVGDTCSDGCGGLVPGTKPLPSCADTGQSGIYPFCFTPTACNSGSNACGAYSTGTTIDYAGTCSASTPALPAWYGQSCNSAANACGDYNSGSLTCSGTCSASTPAAIDQCPAVPGLQCDASLCPAPQPDLSAGGISPTSAITSTPTLFSATVTNGGGAGTGSFRSYVEVQSGSIYWTGLISLAAGVSGSQGASITFGAPATYNVRLCADGSNVVAESNEANNCGGWNAVTVTNAAVPAVSCNVSASSVVVGAPVTYTATPVNGASAPYVWTASDGGSYGSAATASRSFPSVGTYNMQVNATGAASPGFCPPVTVTAAAQPDLTAGLISPTTATAGTPTSFSATVTNGGSAGTGAFTSYVEVQSGSIYWTGPITLSAGASGSQSASVTFASAGTFNVRLCADGANAVTESNEGNNCGSWNSVTVSGGGPPIVSFGTNTSIPLGNNAPLTWSSSGATSCTGTGFATGGATSGGPVLVSPVTTSSYGLSCTGPGGTTIAPPVTITVTGGACTGAGPLTFTASPSTLVKSGTNVTLSWSTTDASSATCTVTNQTTSTVVKTSTVTACAVSDTSATINITRQTSFIVTCGGLTKTLIVNVLPNFKEY